MPRTAYNFYNFISLDYRLDKSLNNEPNMYIFKVS